MTELRLYVSCYVVFVRFLKRVLQFIENFNSQSSLTRNRWEEADKLCISLATLVAACHALLWSTSNNCTSFKGTADFNCVRFFRIFAWTFTETLKVTASAHAPRVSILNTALRDREGVLWLELWFSTFPYKSPRNTEYNWKWKYTSYFYLILQCILTGFYLKYHNFRTEICCSVGNWISQKFNSQGSWANTSRR